MGQGYSMTTLSAASASIDVPELADLVHEKTLASARFMKSVRARSQQGFVFVKAVMKPYSSFQVHEYVRQITEERNILASIPNALGYQRIVEVGSGGFLVRQYMFNSVYDRISTRPFLEDIEKKWLAFQLLCAVRDCHARNVYHGDIKTENILVTSWNWLYLTDFSSSFKPTYLPEDNPADFSFYFDTSSRRTCYIAPERFTTSSSVDTQDELNWAMDIFSVGCAIAEMFLEGPIFSLSQIFKYRAGEYSPEHTHLNKIEDAEVKAMILNMIELDPEKRYSAEQLLSFYRSKIFPDYFYSFLHQYMLDLTRPATASKPVELDAGSLAECDDKINRVYYDFDKISFFLGYGPSPAKQSSKSPLTLRSNNRVKSSEADPSLYDGSLLFLTLVVSSMRNTAKASAKLKACDLLVAFAERLPDEAKLDRILPYIIGLLSDSSDVVVAAGIYAMTAIFEMIEVVSPINAYIFPEYIFPRMRQFILGPSTQPSVLVRSAYASCLASLALSSLRILDVVHAIRADGRLPALREDELAPESSYHGLYDIARAELVPHFEESTVALITDPDPSVRRALLGSVSRLCVFFGSPRASDVILPYLNTYLNDKDWILRCTFFEALVGVASYVGTSSLEKFILPIMVGSLTDLENFVIEKVFRSLARMAALGLLQKSTTWELISIAARFVVHPSVWVRESAVQFIVLSARYISAADQYCIVLPMIQPFLKSRTHIISEERILDNLKRPLPKIVFDAAVNWAARKGNSLFWTAASRDGALTLSDSATPQNPSVLTMRLLTRIPPSQKDKEDQTSLETLKNLGMTADDEIKLLALREYMLRISKHKPAENVNERHTMLNNILALNQIDVTPQNVFFDQREALREIKSRPNLAQKKTRQDERHSLTAALLDASTSIDDQAAKRRSPSDVSSGTQTPSTRPIDIHHRAATLRTDTAPSVSVERASGSSKPSVSNGTGSPLDRLSLRRSKPLELKHRNSGLNLMNRTDSAKADAEISTTSETAFGRVDGPLHRKSTAGPSALSVAANAAAKSRSVSPRSGGSRTPLYEPNHSYAGNDPNVLRLLDHHFMENFPVDQMDFGPNRPFADSKTPIRRATDVFQQNTGRVAQQELTFRADPWRPGGQLVTQFSEHTATINRVCAAPDHAFFVTASDDGTCKVWDTIRLEKNVTPRSRYTHRHAEGAKVKSLCFVDSTHTFLSGADDGSIHAVRVDYKSVDGGESSRYGKPVLVRDYQIPGNKVFENISSTVEAAALSKPEHAVWLYHYRTQTSQSILLAATSECRVLAIDLKNMEIIHIMENPVHHGTPTTFCVDKKHHWLLLGTSHGILDLWDLRFKLRLRSFGTQTDSRIDRLLIHPTKGHGRWVMASADGEISVWDIEKLVCREVWRPSTFTPGTNRRPYETWSPDEENSEKLLSRFAHRPTEDNPLAGPQLGPNLANGSPVKSRSSGYNEATSSRPLSSTPSMPAVYILHDYLLNPAQPDNPYKHALLFTGGDDRDLRYWDIQRPENSFIISGPELHNEDAMALKTKYELTHPLALSAGAQIALIQEKISDEASSGGASSSRGTPKKSSRSIRDQEGNVRISSPASTSATSPSKTSSSSSSSSKPPRSTVISGAQQQILRTHMEGITDVVVLRKPYGCVVSVDRAGTIFIFH
ncbi:Serine/threonine-protein kinase [Exophiala xenobiotica]|uniref:non-specific serine/threonine protein kinase n=1 Tax=Vermiconidia calcicola TaxID=1690605 RepID=A0AAV9QCX4_9PEZI|nr:Serine/threonine-protein kinase [Exophiala xenobiotica]KAK5540066.1 Serine/threonine-protein kinase [Vermiconidia calcicola]KAK5543156.1 Serine/threonine-protein kinase [Chaetothyriales sp. CCFEE 6169]KAK5304329.1 Serine/threonine-protein kinase [Exophiala xenobiotica]KAK5338938.1 Serine/threonine-protein kinase [Exophiala xenobiotica]